MSETPDAIRREVRDIVEPLRGRLAEIDEWMQTHLAALDDLRALRREVVTVLRPFLGEDAIPLEPGRAAKPGPKPGRRYTNTRRGYQHQAMLDDLTAFLRERYNGDVFSGVQVARDSEDRFGTKSTVAKAVSELAQREVIVLDHIGGQRKTTKFYKLV